MALSEHDQQILRDLEESFQPQPPEGRWSRTGRGQDRTARMGGYLAACAIVLTALAVSTIAVALPAPVDIWGSVVGYLLAVAFTSRLATLHRH